MITERVEISQADYIEVNSEDKRFTKEELAYWVAKFKTTYPVEGYGCLGVRLEKEGNKYYIIWDHFDTCD